MESGSAEPVKLLWKGGIDGRRKIEIAVAIEEVAIQRCPLIQRQGDVGAGQQRELLIRRPERALNCEAGAGDLETRNSRRSRDAEHSGAQIIRVPGQTRAWSSGHNCGERSIVDP